MTKFIKGIKLCEDFYNDIVNPIIKSEYPNLRYTAGLINRGSEVLGFDTPISMDHDWGPRVTIFINEEDSNIKQSLKHQIINDLPDSYQGFELKIGKSGNQILEHQVEILTIDDFLINHIGHNHSLRLSALDWLAIPEQKLATIQYGKLFYDKLNMQNIREQLKYYPHDVWLYLMACDWQKISQEEPFVGRCFDAGDELGSIIITSRLVHIMMHLCFLMERIYPPYSKWFSTAFSTLECSNKLNPIFKSILSATSFIERENFLVLAYQEIAKMHNKLDLTEELPTTTTYFYSRKYKVINAGKFAENLLSLIDNKSLLSIKYRGNIDQLTSNCDILCDIAKAKKLY